MGKLVQLLLRKGADINKPTTDGLTPLCVSCQWNDVDTMQLLIDRGGDVERGPRGQSALICASKFDHAPAVRLLVASGANLDRAADDGVTALSVACMMGYEGMVGFFLNEGASVGLPDD